MCDVTYNPMFFLTHIEELLDVIEETADDDDLTRIVNTYSVFLKQ